MPKKIDEKPQTPIERDNTAIKSIFANNEDLLKTIRALFLGLPITEGDKQIIRDTFQNAALLQAVRNRFLPVLTRDAPIGTAMDLWLGVEQMVFGHPRETIEQAVRYKAAAVDFTEQALSLLTNPDGARFSPVFIPTIEGDELQISLLARNQFIRHVEQQLLSIWVVANKDTSSPADVAKRLEQNSTK